MRTAWFDLRAAVRGLFRRPGLVVVGGLTLALGIGANTAIFSVLWGAWLKPIPFPEAERLVWLSDSYRSRAGGGSSMSLANVLDLEAESRLLEDVAVFGYTSYTVGRREAGQVRGMRVDPGFFRILGMPAVAGRGFVDEDGREGAEPVVILGHGLWQELFGGDPGAVGRSLLLDDTPHTVVGVASPDFRFRAEPRFFVPTRWTQAQRQRRGARSHFAIGLLAEGATLEDAREELALIFGRLVREYPDANEGWSVWAAPLREFMVGRDHTLLMVMGGAAFLVLLVACVNVAGLLLARAESRSREMALRRALGAGRGRILGTFLGEGMVLALLGGGLGILVAYGGVDLLLAIFGGQLRRGAEIGLSGPVLGGALALTLLTGLTVSVLPAFRAQRRDVGQDLREGGRWVSRGGSWARKALVVAEIAMAVTLVTGAGLLISTMWRLQNVDMGYDHRRTVMATVSVPGDVQGSSVETAQFYHRVVEEVEALPGVSHAGLINILPPSRRWSMTRLTPWGQDEPGAEQVLVRYVSPGYFQAAGIGLLDGRPFQLDEPVREGAPTPAIVSEPLARRLFSDGTVLGQRIDLGNQTQGLRVIGVVEGVREAGPQEPTWATYYLPFPSAGAFGTMSLVARAEDDPEALTSGIGTALLRVHPEAHASGTAPMTEGVAGMLGDQRFALSLLGCFATLALILGAVGIYGIMSFTVAQRTREVGIRKALGATAGSVMGRVVGRGLRLTVVGLVLGVAASAGLSRFLSALLYQVTPTDPLTLTGVTGVLLATAVLACYLPARRAARVEAMEALRAE